MEVEVRKNVSAMEDNEGGGELKKQQVVLNNQSSVNMANEADLGKEQSCQVCLSNILNNQGDSPKYRLPCQCQICESCCLEYFKQKVLDGNDAEASIRCPNDSCQRLYKLLDLRYDVNNPGVKLPNFEQIDECLLLQWQSRTGDCRGCPKCDYFGFVDGNKVHCKEFLECEKCHEKWQDNQQYKNSRFLPKLSEFLTCLRKVLSTKQCPACRVHIVRNGGCSHMTCKKCTYNFCWYCEGEFARHSQWKCYLKMTIKYSPVIGLALFGLFHSGFHQTLGKLFLKLISMVFQFLALNLLFFLIYLIVTFVKDTKTLLSQLEAASLKGNRTSQQDLKKSKQNFNLACFTTTVTLLYMAGIFILFKYSLLGVIQFAFIEGLIGILGYYVCIYTSFLWNYWMKNVF